MKKLTLLVVALLITLPGFSQCLKTTYIESGVALYDVNTVPTISFSHDSKYVCYGYREGVAKISNMEELAADNYIRVDLENTSVISVCIFHPKKDIVAIGCTDGSLTLYNYIDKKKLKSFEAHKRAITAAEWSGDTLYTAGNEGKINVWTENGELLKSFEISGNAKSICVRGNKIIYNNQKIKNCIRIIDYVSASEKVLSTSGAWKMDVPKDGKLAYLSTFYYGIEIWDLESGKSKGTVSKTTNLGAFYGIAVSNDAELLVYGGQNQALIVQEINGEKICSSTSIYENIAACAISPDKKYMLALTNKQFVRLYIRSKDGKYIQTVKDKTGGVYTGNYTFSTKEDNNAMYVWPDGRKYVGKFEKNEMTTGIIYHPDGKQEVVKPKVAEKESVDLAFYMRITEKEGMGSYVKRDLIIFTRVFSIPLDVATPESVYNAALRMAEAQLEGKDFTYITHQKPNKGEDYESFKKRLINQDGLPWQGFSGYYADFAK